MDEQRVREIVKEELKRMTDTLSNKVVEQSVKALSYGLKHATFFEEETADFKLR